MIISKSFRLADGSGSSTSVAIPNSTTNVTHYPTLGRFVVDSFNDVLANFNAHIEYDEQTSEAELNGAKFQIVVGSTSIRVYVDGDGSIGYNSVSYDSNSYEFNLVVLVKGNFESFELLIASGSQMGSYSTLFGKYSFERLSDGKILTAIRRSTSSGTFWMFEDGVHLGYAAVVKADAYYAQSGYSYSGYALVPAILTNFAYRIVGAYLYCPMLESGTYYTIAGVSVASVQSCLLLEC